MSGQSAEVLVGTDGWLFLSGGSNQVLRVYTVSNAFPDDSVKAWTHRLMARERQASSRGIVYRHLIVPDKLTIYYDKVGVALPYRAASPALRLPAAMSAAGGGHVIVDILSSLMQARTRHDVYWRTDTHWSPEGCFCAYAALCQRLGVPISHRVTSAKLDRTTLCLDLGSKCDPPVMEDFYSLAIAHAARRVHANELVTYKEEHGLQHEAALHVGSHVVFRNDDPTVAKKKLVIFGDSYAEYRTHLLTGMLAESIAEVHFIWSADIDWSYVDDIRPDFIVTEGAERFAVKIPDDSLVLGPYVTDRMARFNAGFG